MSDNYMVQNLGTRQSNFLSESLLKYGSQLKTSHLSFVSKLQDPRFDKFRTHIYKY